MTGLTMKVRLTFTEDLLGTSTNNRKLYEEYIASKAPTEDAMEEEVEALGAEAEPERQMTIFWRDEDGNPFLFDYQIKGFFKDSCKALKKVPGTLSSKTKAYRQDIDGLVFPNPRKIPIHLSGDIGICDRPLRASTPQGERVAISVSESCPSGSWIEFEIECLTEPMYDLIPELLDYGRLRGLGQWRNSGKGRFTWERLA